MASYVTYTEADALITDADWLALTQAEKEKFIAISTIFIDSLPYRYENICHGLENKFPWTGQTKVPQIVKVACTYEALGQFKLSVGKIDKIALKQKQGIVSESTQSASVSFKATKGNLFSLDMFMSWQSQEAMALIYPYTTKTAETGSRVYNEVWRSDIWD